MDERLGLCPVVHSNKQFTLKDQQRRKRKAVSKTAEAKLRRRLGLKPQRNQRKDYKETRDGVTSGTSVALHETSDGMSPPVVTNLSNQLTKEKRPVSIDLKVVGRGLGNQRKHCETREGVTHSTSVALEESSDDINEIPLPVAKPVAKNLSTQMIKEKTAVYFDLETTGLARTSHITRIAAVRGGENFDMFIMPKIPVEPIAAEITGIKVRDGKMFHRGAQVQAVSITEGLLKFINFFKISEKTVLIGHNIKSFDCRVLMNALSACQLTNKFQASVHGFVDTLKLFKLTHPSEQSYSQPMLFKSLMDTTYKAHDGLEDVTALRKLVVCGNPGVNAQQSSSFTVGYVRDCHHYVKVQNGNLPSLQHLIDDKVLSTGMAKKIAGSGLSFCHLQLTYKRHGRKGIQDLFGERDTGGGESNKVAENYTVSL